MIHVIRILLMALFAALWVGAAAQTNPQPWQIRPGPDSAYFLMTVGDGTAIPGAGGATFPDTGYLIYHNFPDWHRVDTFFVRDDSICLAINNQPDTVCVAIGGGGDHDWYVYNTTDIPDNIIDSVWTSGTVGIGIDTPLYALTVVGDSSHVASFRSNSIADPIRESFFEFADFSTPLWANYLYSSQTEMALAVDSIRRFRVGGVNDSGDAWLTDYPPDRDDPANFVFPAGRVTNVFYSSDANGKMGLAPLDSLVSVIQDSFPGVIGGGVSFGTDNQVPHMNAAGDDFEYSPNFTFGNTTLFAVDSTPVVFNEGGVNVDFRVEGIGESNALFVHGANGNVGIGTNAPVGKLDVRGGIVNIQANDLDKGIKFNTSGTNDVGHIYYTGADGLIIKAPGGGTEKITVALSSTSVEARSFDIDNSAGTNLFHVGSTGNVGIGVTAPQTNLHIQESNVETEPALEIEQLSAGDAALQFSIAGNSYAVGIDNDDDQLKFSYSSTAGDAILGTNDLLTLAPTGALRANNYGSGTFADSDDSFIFSGDASGNFQEMLFSEVADSVSSYLTLTDVDSAVVDWVLRNDSLIGYFTDLVNQTVIDSFTVDLSGYADDTNIANDDLSTDADHTTTINAGHELTFSDGASETIVFDPDGNPQLNLSGNLEIPATDATSGQIRQAGNRFLHSFGTNSTFLGSGAGNLTLTGNNNVGIGVNALDALTTGQRNIGIGTNALGALSTGSFNIAIGYAALTSNNGSQNTAVGYAAGNSATGTQNSIFGYQAYSGGTGNNNMAIGYQTIQGAQDNNVAVGAQAGKNNTGSGNVFLGYLSGQNATGNSNLYIENSASTNPLIWGDFANDSLRVNGVLDVTGNLRFQAMPVAGTISQVLAVDANDIVISTDAPGLADFVEGDIIITESQISDLAHTPLQTLTGNQDTVFLSGNPDTVIIVGDGTGTDDQQVTDFSIAANVLSLEVEDDGQPPHTVDLSPYLDNTDTRIDSMQIRNDSLFSYVYDVLTPSLLDSIGVDLSVLSGTDTYLGNTDQTLTGTRIIDLAGFGLTIQDEVAALTIKDTDDPGLNTSDAYVRFTDMNDTELGRVGNINNGVGIENNVNGSPLVFNVTGNFAKVVFQNDNSTADNLVVFNGNEGAEDFIFGVDDSRDTWAFGEGSFDLSDLFMEYHSSGDSLVFLKDIQLDSIVLDADGDAGTSGQVLTANADGTVNWSSAGSGNNGIFGAANDGGTVPTNFDFSLTDWMRIDLSSNGVLNLHGVTGADVAYTAYSNLDAGVGTGLANGFIVGMNAQEQALLWNIENTDMNFHTNNILRMTIEDDGDVGIGTAAPLAQLHVSTITAQDGLRVEWNGESNTGISLISNTTDTDDADLFLRQTRTTTGTALDGIGMSYQYNIEDADGNAPAAVLQEIYWHDVSEHLARIRWYMNNGDGLTAIETVAELMSHGEYSLVGEAFNEGDIGSGISFRNTDSDVAGDYIVFESYVVRDNNTDDDHRVINEVRGNEAMTYNYRDDRDNTRPVIENNSGVAQKNIVSVAVTTTLDASYHTVIVTSSTADINLPEVVAAYTAGVDNQAIVGTIFEITNYSGGNVTVFAFDDTGTTNDDYFDNSGNSSDSITLLDGETVRLYANRIVSNEGNWRTCICN